LSSRTRTGNICSYFNNKQIKQNETTPPILPTDGNVSVGTTNVGESGNTEQKVLQGSVSNPLTVERVKEMLK
jgi:hypothetical protein